MNAVAYCRVSTVGQRDEGVSLEMQQERIAIWCTNNGYEPDEVFVEVMSGGRAANRPELQEAVALAFDVDNEACWIRNFGGRRCGRVVSRVAVFVSLA